VRVFLAAMSLLAALLPMGPASAVQITNVSAEPARVPQIEDAEVALVFRLSEPASVTLNVYDGRDLLIRRIDSDGRIEAGDQRLTWDLRDQSGRPVPAEAYHYTLIALSSAGRRVEHDLTDLTAGDDLVATEVAWDPESKVIRYRLPAAGRVNIRVGLDDNGPLLATVLDWVVRDAGVHEEPWDGFDAAGVLDLSHHPKLAIAVDAFGLSDNSILVGPAAARVELIRELPWGRERRVAQRHDRKRMHFHRQQPLEERGDYRISLTLPDNLPRDAEGLPILTGIVPIRLDVSEDDRERVLERRFEPVFFVDGTFVFENEVGFLPMTWRWDTAGVNQGVHFLTANLRGYEGNFGMTTLKVRVMRMADEAQGSDAALISEERQ
jgi:hypothetical protein